MEEVPQVAPEIEMKSAVARLIRRDTGFWTLYYRLLFRLKGVRFGRGLRVCGPLILRLLGSPTNLIIGDNVTIMPMVDLKLREQGRIILHDGVFLDTMTRLVAANQGTIELGEDVKVGIGSIINAGADVTIGRQSLIAGYCNIDSSKHLYEGEASIASQGYEHSPVHIGEDSWLGVYSFVGPGSELGKGVILGARASVFTGSIPPYCVAVGTPARVIKERRQAAELPEDLAVARRIAPQS